MKPIATWNNSCNYQGLTGWSDCVGTLCNCLGDSSTSFSPWNLQVNKNVVTVRGKSNLIVLTQNLHFYFPTIHLFSHSSEGGATFLRWQASFYFNLPVLMGSGPLRRTNKQRKEASRQISYFLEGLTFNKVNKLTQYISGYAALFLRT